MRFKNCISLLLILLSFNISANGQELAKTDTLQKKGVWLFVNQPISLIYKFNPQLGYRFSDRHAIIAGFTAYYIKRKGETLLFNREFELTMNGNRFSAEYRYHFAPQPRFETYVYGNIIGGSINCKDTREGLLVDVSFTDEFKGKYVGGGIGLGHQLFFKKYKKIILQFNYGVSYFNLFQVTGDFITKEEATKILIFRPSFYPLEFSIRFGYRL